MKPYLYFFVIIGGLTIVACKSNNDKANGVNQIPKTGNDITKLEGTGIQDVSHLFGADPTQAWPNGVGVVHHFGSGHMAGVYLTEASADKTDYSKLDLIAVVGEKIGGGVDFIVDSVGTTSPFVMNLRTVPNQKVMNEHRPSFVFTIPKSLGLASPVIRLNGTLLGVIQFK